MKVLNELYTVRETADIATTICGSVIMCCDLLHLVQLNGEIIALEVSGLVVCSSQVLWDANSCFKKCLLT